ncbi:MAG: TAXI family TRAP transporter solute-binding subunit [Thiolinea sp.]
MVQNTIPKDTYSGQVNKDEDVPVWQTVMMLVVKKDMSDDTAYTLTKTYFDNLEAVQSSNELLKGVRFGAVITPLHPGAARYYQEQDIEIPAELQPE